MNAPIVIVGAGQCGGQTALSLREAGSKERIVLIGDEPQLPYQRPPLSKMFLAGKMPAERTLLKPAAAWAEQNIEVRTGTRVEAIDREGATLRLAGGETLAWSKLVLATGSRVRTLSAPGADLPGICYLRTLADVEGIRARMAPGRHMTVVGGGYIGLEAASVAIEAGMKVTLIEAAPRLLGRVTSPEMSAFFDEVHRAKGVDIRCNTALERFEGGSQVEAVVAGGERIATDVAVVGVGILPNVELAAAAGLAVDNGIVVDDHCRTSDARIYAAGDCTSHPNPIIGRSIRLESVQNAVDQAKVVAANLCGQDKAYAEFPWFWSNQYDVRLQIAGLSQGYDSIVWRGERTGKAFLAFYLKDGVVIAADAVNLPREFMAVRKLLPGRPVIDPAKLADPAWTLQ